jgi:hypothetical protein
MKWSTQLLVALLFAISLLLGYMLYNMHVQLVDANKKMNSAKDSLASVKTKLEYDSLFRDDPKVFQRVVRYLKLLNIPRPARPKDSSLSLIPPNPNDCSISRKYAEDYYKLSSRVPKDDGLGVKIPVTDIAQLLTYSQDTVAAYFAYNGYHTLILFPIGSDGSRLDYPDETDEIFPTIANTTTPYNYIKIFRCPK